MLIDFISIGFAIVAIGSLVALEGALDECRRATVDVGDGRSSNIPTTTDFIIASRIITFGLVVFIGVQGADLWARALNSSVYPVLSATPIRFALLVVVGIPVVVILTGLGYVLPARLAERYPREFAAALAPIGRVLTKVLAPCIAVIRKMAELMVPSASTPEEIEEEALEEDIKSLVEEGEKAGVIEEEEKQIITRVFHLGDRTVASLMTHRADVVFLPGGLGAQAALVRAIDSRFTWFPVIGEGEDDILGIVSIHDLVNFSQDPEKHPSGLKELVSSPLEVPDSITALELLETFRTEGAHFAIVRDEHGSVAGIATVDDVLKVIVGELGESGETERSIIVREDGSWLVDASSDVDNLFEVLGLRGEPGENGASFHSVGGFVMTSLGHIPKEGDLFLRDGYRFEVVDMDGKRIDKVLVSRVGAKNAAVGS